jgi:DNA-binding MarR family transcriptional regulator
MQKDIAFNTELSKGIVSRVVTKMIESGYVIRKDKKLELANFDDLYSAWVESEMKRRERKRRYYVWTQNPRKLMERISAVFSGRKIKYAFTQEAGASLVAPFAVFDIVSAYVESLDKIPEKALSASETDKGFNLTLIEAPDQYIFTKAQNKSGMMVVDNLQLYADLKKNPLRGEKQANHIFKIIKQRLK